MVMFNGTKLLNSQSKHANILKGRHFPRKYNTMSIHFLQDNLQEKCIDLQNLVGRLARYFQELHFSNLGNCRFLEFGTNCCLGRIVAWDELSLYGCCFVLKRFGYLAHRSI